MDDVIRNLERLQRYAAGLQGMIEDAQSVMPPRVECTDAHGAVRVVVGPDGLPELIEVNDDWTRRLRPDHLGRAVLEATQAATDERMAGWTAAIADDGWQAEAERLRERVEAEPVTGPTDPVPAELSRTSSEVRPRDPSAITHDVIKILDNLDELAESPTPFAQGVGSAGYGKLVVTLSQAGMVSCLVDPGWVQHKTGEELTEALALALASARDDLARTAEDTPAGQLDRLLREAHASRGQPDLPA